MVLVYSAELSGGEVRCNGREKTGRMGMAAQFNKSAWDPIAGIRQAIT
jgi:hypothetical protein